MIELLNMDCMDYLREQPDKSFDLAIVDPPYGIGVDGKNIIENNSDKYNQEINKKDHQWDTERPKDEYFTELKRVADKQIIWGGNYYLDILGYCKAPIIWDKLNGGSMYADGEMAWTSSKMPKNLKIWRHQWCGAFKDSERRMTRIHPTQKPVKLYDWLLRNYAEPGQRILDTHLGSGSSAIAAHYFGVDFVGIEIDEDYYNAALNRFNNETRQIALI